MLKAYIGLLTDQLDWHVKEKVGAFGYVATEADVLYSYLKDIGADFLEDSETAIIENKPVTRWLGDLKDVCYDLDDLLDYNAYMAESKLSSYLSLFSGLGFNLRIHTCSKIRKFCKRIEEIRKRGESLNMFPRVDSEGGQKGYTRPSTTNTFTEDGKIYGCIGDVAACSKIRKFCKRIEDIRKRGERLKMFRGVDSEGGQKGYTRPSTTNTFTEDGKIYGRKGDVAAIIGILLRDEDEDENEGEGEEKDEDEDEDEEGFIFASHIVEEGNIGKRAWVVPIVGVGGIGKTTVAKLIYDDPRVDRHFDARAWVNVSDDFDPKRIIRDVFGCLSGEVVTNTVDGLETLLVRLKEMLEGKFFLLVLDDVSISDEDLGEWEQLTGILVSVCTKLTILVTTRKEEVKDMVGSADKAYHLRGLTSQDCWEMFADRAFSRSGGDGRQDLEEIGREIVARCKGSPLAAKVLGNLMESKATKAEWQSVMESQLWDSLGAANNVFHILRLSYNNLPPSCKQCLLFCVAFPKDHPIEIEMLIKLWMSHGYLRSNLPEVGEGTSSRGCDAMEKLGLTYLYELLVHSFLHDFRESDMTCKIHGIVYDFLQSLPLNECFRMNVDHLTSSDKIKSSYRKSRHSTLVVSAYSPLPGLDYKLETIRSLLVLSRYTLVRTKYLTQLFNRLTHLRALSLSCSSIDKIPSQVRRMIFLRYLNFSYNRNLKELPEAVCDLYYLQTLNLNGCDNLEKLPQAMGKLVNLRHLEILWTFKLAFLPKGIGKLSSLLTLNRFIVNRSSGVKGCNVKDLENLDKLQGYLYIDGLGDVENVEEARRAGLESKKGLVGLDLWFSGVENGDVVNPVEVLDALEPPSELEYLGIYYYGGTTLPIWMATLNKLTELILFNCRNCDIAPCLSMVGTLPCLETLEIRDMDNLTKLSFDASRLTDTPIFPKLARLSIHNMRQWEDWEVLTFLPRLVCLTIGCCPKLKTLPPMEVGDLIISQCAILESCFQRQAEDWCTKPHISNVEIDGKVVKKDGKVVKEDGRHVSELASSPSKVRRAFTRKQSQIA